MCILETSVTANDPKLLGVAGDKSGMHELIVSVAEWTSQIYYPPLRKVQCCGEATMGNDG